MVAELISEEVAFVMAQLQAQGEDMRKKTLAQLIDQGTAMEASDEFEGALHTYQKALSLAQEMGCPKETLANLMNRLAAMHVKAANEKKDNAKRNLGDAMMLEQGSPDLEGMALQNTERVTLCLRKQAGRERSQAKGHERKARLLWNDVLSMGHDTGCEEKMALSGMALLAIRLRHKDQAVSSLQKLLVLQEGDGHEMDIARTKLAIAKLLKSDALNTNLLRQVVHTLGENRHELVGKLKEYKRLADKTRLQIDACDEPGSEPPSESKERLLEQLAEHDAAVIDCERRIIEIDQKLEEKLSKVRSLTKSRESLAKRLSQQEEQGDAEAAEQTRRAIERLDRKLKRRSEGDSFAISALMVAKSTFLKGIDAGLPSYHGCPSDRNQESQLNADPAHQSSPSEG